ncbi:MAG: DUF885 domain-containing protein [Nocardioides sp.]
MSDDLDQLAADYWEALLDAEPTWRHLLGDYTDVGSYEDGSRAAEDTHIAMLRDFAARAEAIDDDGLDDQQRLTRGAIVSTAAATADLLATRGAELNADPVHGSQLSLRIVIPMLAIPDADAAAAMPTKYAGIGAHFGQLADRVSEGVARGWASPKFAVEGTIAQIEELLATPLDDDLLLHTGALPEGVDEAEFRSGLRDAIERDVRAGLTAYRDALRDQALPIARPDDKVGLSWLGGGAEAYDAALRYFTTTSLKAEEIHQIGLDQVARLGDEYRALGPEVVGTDDLQQIFEAMRTDPALHFETGEEMVEKSREALARAESAMGEWFETVPQAPCAVESTLVGAKAFYFPPASDGTRGGTFFINVDDVEAWGRFELESMAFHEGVPGHHLQLAIAAELPDSIPDFRKHVHNSAYAEGWGLYTERLADEMGLYTEAIDRMGMYSADSLRACRLVVDTGIHALGWSRQQAVDYMLENSPMAEGVVRPEIDRYICSPGQATSYMIGRLEIQRMRAEAEQRQGDGFEIKAFHSAVLDGGSLPLAVLDEVVRSRLA